MAEIITSSSSDEDENDSKQVPALAVGQGDLFGGSWSEVGVTAPKDDLSTMEFPVFALQAHTRKKLASSGASRSSLLIREFRRGTYWMRVIPSAFGPATINDKDLLIYAMSMVVAVVDSGARLPSDRRVRILVGDFIRHTGRSDGGASYERVLDMCRRLRGTTLETNIRTLTEEETKGFSLIDDYTVVRSTRSGKGATEIEITLSEWFWRHAAGLDVLTLSPGYFQLSRPLEKRLYELARKHVGQQPMWKIDIRLLQEKCGSTRELKYFRRDLQEVVDDNTMPEYRVLIDSKRRPAHVVFLTRQMHVLVPYLQKHNLVNWYNELTQQKIKS